MTPTRASVLCVALALLLAAAPAISDRPEPLPLHAPTLMKHLDRAIAAGDEERIERVVRVLVVLNRKARRVLEREVKRESPRLPYVLEALSRMEPSLRLMARPLLGHEDPETRARAAAAIDGADARVLMAALAAEKNRQVQYALIGSIAASEEKTVAQFLSGELAAADPGRRIQALKGLKLRGERGALPEIYAALRDPQPLVRHAGIEAVAAMGDTRGVRVLLDLAHIEDDERNQAAIWEALRTMTGHDHGEDPEAWQRWLDAAG